MKPTMMRVVVVAAAIAAGAVLSAGRQAPSVQSAPAYTLLTAEGARALAARRVGGQDMFALDDLAPIFGLTVREDALAGGVTVTVRNQTIVLSAGQMLASVGGRLISLPAPPVRDGRSWLVPVEFVNRAIGPLSGTRIDLRQPPRLVIVGDLTVPRVAVRFDDEGGGRARLTFDVDPATPHQVTTQNGRLVVGFDANAIDARLGAVPPGPLVAGIRAADGTPTVVLDLGPAFASYRASDVAGGEGGARFVVEIVGAAPPPPPPPAVPAAPAAPAPEPPPLIDATPPGGLRAIVIDPGHGGVEDGARGADGTLEKDVTLAVARRLEGAIEGRLGIRVILTRDGDQTVGLDERAARANNNKADLFISLHANAAARTSTAGAEVFYLNLVEYGTEAEQAARDDGVPLPVFGGGTRQIQLIPWEMAQARYIDQSAAFAGMVEAQLHERVPMNLRPLAQAPFRVLVGANMPAVLVEMGFLTNPDEERMLTSESFQTSVVQALVESIIQFRGSLRAPMAAAGGGW